MKKINLLVSAVILCIGLAACGEAQVDETALNTAVQLRSAALIEQANAEYEANCEARMETELKAMTDSIVNARKVAAGAQ